jgi:hypothetical protein
MKSAPSTNNRQPRPTQQELEELQDLYRAGQLRDPRLLAFIKVNPSTSEPKRREKIPIHSAPNTNYVPGKRWRWNG